MAYYQQYLELNPGNAQIRMRVAYDLAQGGDPAGAMDLVQVGLDVNPEDANLWEMFGGFAFAAGLEANQKAGTDASGVLSAEAADFFRKAIEAYGKVYAAKGAETPVGHMRNVIAAHVQLKEYEQGIAVAERTLQTHPDEVSIWSVYADALQPAGRLDEALAALDKVKQLNPQYPGVALRQANWLVQAGRTDDAVRVLRSAVQDLTVDPDVAAGLLFSDAYANGINRQRYSYAITGISAAKQIPNVTSKMTSQLHFWHAFSLYMGAVAEQQPQTVETARATLPKFQQAIEIFPLAREYAATQQSINLNQFLQNAQTYIEIQEAIIKRGR
jgi:tetratricopeptide (TPR) repeat protein